MTTSSTSGYKGDEMNELQQNSIVGERAIDEALLAEAIEIATTAHFGQVDKGGRPYIEHPLHLASQLKAIAEKIVAVLHDVLEDTSITREYLAQRGFPTILLDALDCLTKREGETYSEFIERASLNELARKVKRVDLEHNADLSRIKDPTPHHFKRSITLIPSRIVVRIDLRPAL
jgi:(p)ppGpp synthase/HD superfamily hydrolase